ncbi:MAG: FliH/SctL family protein [Clostridia bacterium]|nr:hypothetical protein [Clostridiaceae bacterium]
MVKILKAQEVSDILQDMPKVLIKSTTRRCQEEDADRLYEQAKAQSEALIQRSKKLALSIVANARAEAQEILNEAREMSTVIFEKAREEGYQKGLALGEEKSAYLVESAESEKNKILEQAYKEKTEILNSVHTEILNLSMNVAEKILGYQLSRNEKVFQSLVLNAIKKVTWEDKIKISVSETDYERFFEGDKQERFKAEYFTDVVFEKDDSLKKGDCILHTSKGKIDASVSTQLDNIKEALGV